MAKQKKGEQSSFILYYDSISLIEKLSDKDAGQLLKAVFRYKVRGEKPNLSPAADMAFTAIQNYLDRDAESYRDKCEKNAENGRKGGLVTQERARQQVEANQANASNDEANQADNDNDIDSDSETDSENDLEGYKGCGETRIDWSIFQKAAKRAYDQKNVYTLEECLRVFKYFFDKYEEYTGEKHPALSKEAISEIMRKMPYIEGINSGGADVHPDDYEVLIDRYFDTPFEDCDYHITHFFSGEIRNNRFFETLY